MKILLTGASGFLGQHTKEAFLKAGHTVCAITRRGVEEKEHKDVSYLYYDLLENKVTPSVFSELEIDVLVHLAWDVTPGKYWNALNNVDWCNASNLLIRAAIEGGVQHVIGVGTSAEYTWQGVDFLSPRTTALQPESLYGECKCSVRRIGKALADLKGVPFAWARVFFPYGIYEPSGRLVPSVISSLLRGEVARCSSGLQERDFINAEDVARSLVCIAEEGFHGDINIASGDCISVRSLVQVIQKLIGGEVEFGAIPLKANEPARLAVDVSDLESIGFRCQVGLEEGLNKCIDWWRKQI